MTLKEKLPEQALDLETLRKYMQDPTVFMSIVLLESVIINHVKTMKLLREFLCINDTKKLEEVKIKADELAKEIILGIKPEITIDTWVDTKNNQQYINSNYL